MELKRAQREAGRTRIHVTHDQEPAMTVADRMTILEQGVIAQVRTPAELYDRPNLADVARLLGAPMMNLIPSEAALLGPAPDGAARIVSVDPLGGSTVLTLAALGLTLRATLRGQSALQTGQPVRLTAAPKRMHPVTSDGQRIAALA